MDNDIDIQNKPRSNKPLAGIILLIVGCVLLFHQLDLILFPHWLFRWPMILIAIGLYSGAKHNFRSSSWFIFLLLGLVFMINDAFSGHNVDRVTWPILIIAFGLWMILRRNTRWDKNRQQWDKWSNQNPQVNPAANAEPVGPNEPKPDDKYNYQYGGKYSYRPYGDDFLDAVSVFGGVKKTILSKDFKGGDIVNIFGGAELDLTQSDISGRVVIDITQIFGGTKIVVPSNWQVVSDMVAVFASVDDKRLKSTAGPDTDKVLVLKGVSMFAGIDIRSY
jgi:predicted membrane protein